MASLNESAGSVSRIEYQKQTAQIKASENFVFLGLMNVEFRLGYVYLGFIKY
jgi:hypothetical protein